MKTCFRSATLFLAAAVALALSTGCGVHASSATANQASGASGTGSGSGSSGSGSGSSGSSGSGGSGSGSGSYPSSVPSDAIAVSGIQVLDTWDAAYDTGTSGASSGIMSLVAAPSMSGQAREFATTYSDSGGERYYVSFGADTTSTNFFYDVWVYLPDSPTDIANLEFDMNQVMANGQTVIFGFQCDGYASAWDYTENAGTPQIPVDHWVHSAASCNVHNWSTETWHHVQVSYSRDNSGNVTYNSVWLDGVEQQINATAPSAFALGWGSTLLTNFQVDGLGASGSSTAYLDDLTVYRW